MEISIGKHKVTYTQDCSYLGLYRAQRDGTLPDFMLEHVLTGITPGPYEALRPSEWRQMTSLIIQGIVDTPFVEPSAPGSEATGG